jgi:hypothetical protein
MVTMEVLLEGSTLDRSIAIGRESTGQHADTASGQKSLAGRRRRRVVAAGPVDAHYPKLLSSGLSRMLDILYSKFCAATELCQTYSPHLPSMSMGELSPSGLRSLTPFLIIAWISPHAPPRFGLFWSLSKRFKSNE